MFLRICSFDAMKTAFSSGVSRGYDELQGLCQRVADVARKIFFGLYNLVYLRTKSCSEGPLNPQVKEKCKISILELAQNKRKIQLGEFSQEDAKEVLSKCHAEDLFLMLIELIQKKKSALIDLFLESKDLVRYLESDKKNTTLVKRAKKVINEMETGNLKTKLEMLL